MSPLLFSTPSYSPLANSICKLTDFELGMFESRLFADGERYLRIQSDVRGRDVVLLGGSIDDRSTLDLFDLSCAIVGQGARSFRLVIPYFGYSTMERAIRPGEVVTAKTRARLFSAIPAAPFGNELTLLDLHTEGLPFYFEGPLRTRHLYAKPIILEAARRLGGARFVLGCTDAGRAKWVESLANDLGQQASFVFKRRAENGVIQVTGVNANVTGQKVIVYDDMIRSGGSVVQAVNAYRNAGAASVDVIATHGLFTGDAVASLRGCGLIGRVVCTDSHPHALRAQEKARDLIEVVSIDALVARVLEKDWRSHG